MTRLTAIIPATDRRPTLDRVVSAVQEAHDAPEEVIVVDEPLGLGPAAARNLGARRAQGEILVFVDSDVEVHDDVFVRIRESFADDPELAAVFGSYDDEPGVSGLVSDFRNLLHHHVHQANGGRASTFWAGLGAIRRDVFLDLGGFDEERFPSASVEDIELGGRLSSTGWRIELDPAIQGKHLKGWTLGSMVATDLRRRGVPWLRLVLERRSSATALNLGWRHRASTALSMLVLLGFLRRSSWLVLIALTLLGVLDRAFYGVLWKRGGARLAAAGLPLHLIHRLVSAAVVPIAVVGHLWTRWTKQ